MSCAGLAVAAFGLNMYNFVSVGEVVEGLRDDVLGADVLVAGRLGST